MERKLKSRYIIDVSITDNYVELRDSQNNVYYIDVASAAFADFKNWFKNVFIKGIPQFLTVFEYTTETRNESEVFCVISKIYDNWTRPESV